MGFAYHKKGELFGWISVAGAAYSEWQALIFSGDTEKPVSYVDSFFAKPDTGSWPDQHW